MLYLKVYNALVNQIYRGQLKKGDRLPSVRALSEQYGVACNTIRIALTMLHTNGFISKSERQATRVIFDNSDADTLHALSGLVAERKEAILDAYRARSLLLPSMAAAALPHLSPQDLDTLDRLCCHMDTAGFPQCLELGQQIIATILERLEIPLAHTLLEATDINTTLPFVLYNQDTFPIQNLCQWMAKNYRDICTILRERRYDELKTAIYRHYQTTGETLADILDELQPNAHHGKNSADSLPMHYMDAHLYATVSYEILMDLISGKYPKGSLLPSENSLCAIYGTSLKTIRKALSTLQEMHMIHTVNGKGSLANYDPQSLPGGSWVQENVKPHLPQLWQGFALLQITMPDLARHAAQQDGFFDFLAQHREMLLGSETIEHLSPFALVDLIVEFIHCNVLDNLYFIVQMKIIWCFYLTYGQSMQMNLRVLREIHERAIASVRDPQTFSQEVANLIRNNLEICKAGCRLLRLPAPV